MSNFEKVVDFNWLYGVIESKVLVSDKNVLVDKPDMIKFCMKLIREEMSELEEAIKNKDLIEVLDAIGDILYVVYGMSARMGYNADKLFDIIHKNNMEKLCGTEEIAKETVEMYKQQFGTDVKYRIAADENNYVVYRPSTLKVLKSKTWKAVDLRSFTNE
jgi:hypothetical protein